MNIKNVIIGLIIVIGGIIMVAKKEWFVNNVGRLNFFEEKMGPGYSGFGYQVIACLLYFLGL